MRAVHVGLFTLGTLSFLASAMFIGQGWGDTFWRAGVAAMLTVMVCARLWPAAKQG